MDPSIALKCYSFPCFLPSSKIPSIRVQVPWEKSQDPGVLHRDSLIIIQGPSYMEGALHRHMQSTMETWSRVELTQAREPGKPSDKQGLGLGKGIDYQRGQRLQATCTV